MGKEFYTIYSHDRESLSKLVNEIENDLLADKIGFTGPSPLPKAHSGAIRRVEDSKPLNNHNLLWLRNVNPHRLGYIITLLLGVNSAG